MSASQEEKNSWNEFQWEFELRKDDARVSTYIDELPKYIDLPDEDGIILRNMQKRGGREFANPDGWWSAPSPVPYKKDEDPEWDGEEEEPIPDPFSGDWIQLDGGILYRNCAALAHDFSIFAAEVGAREPSEKLARVLCIYGELIARSADLIDMSMTLDPEEFEESDPAPKALRIALCKRLLAKINDLMGELKGFSAEPDIANYIRSHREACGHMHDYMIAVLTKLRTETDEPPIS